MLIVWCLTIQNANRGRGVIYLFAVLCMQLALSAFCFLNVDHCLPRRLYIWRVQVSSCRSVTVHAPELKSDMQYMYINVCGAYMHISTGSNIHVGKVRFFLQTCYQVAKVTLHPIVWLPIVHTTQWSCRCPVCSDKYRAFRQ